ncbi:MAG: toll/interleukin-1 receptor domain-containing protein, partial [Planctomycetota bacterium]|nr:toll/interleukin-1 receptor domain-containing protein [Planctomycetota bacterium]
MIHDRTKSSPFSEMSGSLASARKRRAARARTAPRFDALEQRALLAISSVTSINPLTPHPLVGNSYTGTVAFFNATDAGPFTAIINWGDGHASPGTISPVISGGFQVTGTHTYAALTIPGAPDNVTVSIVDTNDPPGTPPSIANSTAVVDDVPITPAPTTVNAFRGFAVSNVDVADFTVTNPFASASTYTATINWGDSTPNTAAKIVEDAGSVFHVEGSHTYNLVGTYPINVSIQNLAGSSATLSLPSTAIVTNSNIAAQFTPIVAAEGTTLNNAVVATFTDTGGSLPIANYSATINWGDGSGNSPATQIINTGGFNYEVLGTHLYENGGNFPVSVTIDSNAAPAAITSGQATVNFAPPLAAPINFNTPERQQYNGSIATFSVIPGTFAGPPGDYFATVSWGDGTPPNQGSITALGNGQYIVNGIHTYADVPSSTSVVYPVTVTIHDLVGATYAQVIAQATVNAVPIVLTGRLDPATDTGVSHFDAITSDNMPRFYGTSESNTTVTLTAVPIAGGTPIVMGKTVADGTGSWAITSEIPLPDGKYNVFATAVDQGGVNSATIQILPNAGQGPLTIDTQGPKITGFQFDPLTGQFAVTYQDNIVGLDQASILNGANYTFTATSTRTHLPIGAKFLVTSLTTAQPADPTAPQVVYGVVNDGATLRGGLYTFTILSGTAATGIGATTGTTGVEDIAGNALDGEFYGNFPTGNNQPGGDFIARINEALQGSDVFVLVMTPAALTSQWVRQEMNAAIAREKDGL